MAADLDLGGFLSISKVYSDGRVEKVFEQKNVITLPAKRQVLSAVYASSVAADPVSSLQVGIGGTVDPSGLYPKPTNQALTSLYTTYASIATSYTVDDGIPAVSFLADLDQGTGNGQLINEAGLFRSSGTMFNIKTFPGIPKTSEFSIHFEWTIKIP